MMGLGKGTPAAREYSLSVLGWMTLYVLLILTVSWADDAERLSGPIVYAAALSPSVPIGGLMWAVLRFMTRSDEFVRAVLAKRFVVTTGIMLFLCVAYGFLETYADVPHAPLWLAFPTFWAVFGLVSPFVRTSR